MRLTKRRFGCSESCTAGGIRGSLRRFSADERINETLRARVENGRLFLNEPTTFAEGTVLDLVADDEDDNLTDEERRVLHAALAGSWNSARAGKVRPASEILGELRSRR